MEMISNANNFQWYKRGQWIFEKEMDTHNKIRKSYYIECLTGLLPKRALVTTQKYYSGAYMEETVHDITPKTRQWKKWQIAVNIKLMGYFNSKTSIYNVMYTLFYTNVYEFSGNCKWIRDKGMYQKNSICTLLVGRLINSSLLMYQYWVIVLGLHNFLTSVTALKYVSNITVSICGKLWGWKW